MKRYSRDRLPTENLFQGDQQTMLKSVTMQMSEAASMNSRERVLKQVTAQFCQKRDAMWFVEQVASQIHTYFRVSARRVEEDRVNQRSKGGR